MRLNQKIIFYAVTVFAALGAVNAQASTIGLAAIEVDGDKLVNDSVLDVTWADLMPAHDVTYYTDRYGINYRLPNNEILTYAGSAQEWIASLNSANYGGHNDWRLSKC